MLDLKLIEEKQQVIEDVITLRGMKNVSVSELIQHENIRKQMQQEIDTLRQERNEKSSQIPKLSKEEKASVIARVKEIKEELSGKERLLEESLQQRNVLWEQIPNLLAPDVPHGGEEDFKELRKVGNIPEIQDPKDHVALGLLTDTIDFERGAKVVGSRFYYLKREVALLEQALLHYAVGKAMKAGFAPMVTPDLARDEVLTGIGFNPRGEETQIYSIEAASNNESETQGLSLVGTAEITLGGYHKDEIVSEDNLPLQYIGLSHCFRTEAGAYGKASKGLYRVHQFSKAELFILCKPDESDLWLDKILELEESIVADLKIPYRAIVVASGDLGAPAFKKYDIEAWMPGRNAYGEITSCSNCTDYQARRLGVRYKSDTMKKPEFVHMLNGTAVATSRMIIAIMENYQQPDGTIKIPQVLIPFMHGTEIIPVRKNK